MSSVPHECPPAGRRCFTCHPRVGTEHAGELPEWMHLRHGVHSEVEIITRRLRATLVAAGVDQAVANREAPLLCAAVVAALDIEGRSADVLGAFVDHYQRGSR